MVQGLLRGLTHGCHGIVDRAVDERTRQLARLLIGCPEGRQHLLKVLGAVGNVVQALGPASTKGVEHLVDEMRALIERDALCPLGNGIVEYHALAVEPQAVQYAASRHLPGAGVMLRDAHGLALHHAAMVVRLGKQHAHHAVGGHNAPQAVPQHLARVGKRQLGGHARPVVAEHAQDMSTQLLKAVDRRILGQVAALRMAAHHHGIAQLGGARNGPVQVLRRHALCLGNLEAQHEVLAPANQRGVGPTIRDIGQRGGQVHLNSGKLQRALLVVHVAISAQLCILEARTLGKQGQKAGIKQRERAHKLLRVATALADELPARARKADGTAVLLAGHDAREVEVRQTREDHVVYVVEGTLIERYIPTPHEVVVDVCHAVPPA